MIGSGTTPSSSDDDAYIGTINWLQSGDINGGIIANANKRLSIDTLDKYPALSVYKQPFIIVAMSINIRYGFVNSWIIPFLLFAIIIKTFFDTRTGMFLHITTCVAVSIIMDNPFEYFIMQFITGYFLLMSYEKLNRRNSSDLQFIVLFISVTNFFIQA